MSIDWKFYCITSSTRYDTSQLDNLLLFSDKILILNGSKLRGNFESFLYLYHYKLLTKTS